MQSAHVQNLLLQKQLGDRLAWTIKRHQVRFVLIASAKAGDGKSLYAGMIRSYLQCRYPGRFFFLAQRDLYSMAPAEIPEGIVALIDGPAILEEADSLALPLAWQDAIRDAVLVVRGRSTTADELQESFARLEAMEIRCIGAIYNQEQDPSWLSRKAAMGVGMKRLLAWLKKPFREALRPTLLPQLRRFMKVIGAARAQRALPRNPRGGADPSPTGGCAPSPSRLGRADPRTIPRIAMAFDQLTSLDLDHRSGFVLSLVDGILSLDEILTLSALPRVEALRILTELVELSVIQV